MAQYTSAGLLGRCRPWLPPLAVNAQQCCSWARRCLPSWWRVCFSSQFAMAAIPIHACTPSGPTTHQPTASSLSAASHPCWPNGAFLQTQYPDDAQRYQGERQRRTRVQGNTRVNPRLHVPTFRCLAVTYAGGSLHMCVCVQHTFCSAPLMPSS